MTFDDYQKDALRTCRTAGHGPMFDLLVIALWAQSEMGEVAGAIAKAAAKGVDLTPEQLEHIADELGDSQWGIAAVSGKLGRPLSQIVDHNVAKRERKYGSSTSQGEQVRVKGTPLPAPTTDGVTPWALYVILTIVALVLLTAAVFKLANP